MDQNEKIRLNDTFVDYKDLTPEQRAGLIPPKPSAEVEPGPVDNDGDITLVPRPTASEITNDLHKAVDENTVVTEEGNKEILDSPLVHPATELPESPVNAEAPKEPVIASRVFERTHPGTEAAEAAESAHEPTAEHPVDKATLTTDNGLAQTDEKKKERKHRTKHAAHDATGHSSAR